MKDDIGMTYSAETKTAVLTFPNGRQLKVTNVTEQQAREFVAKHGKEFERRDCILNTTGGIEVRANG